MDIEKKESCEKLRIKTDKSLEDERGKTDDYLTRKSAAVTQEAENTIRLDRLMADEKRAYNRADALPGENAQAMLIERQRADRARNLEREKEDRVRSKERFEKRLIAEALLENERRETDTNLLDERAGIDQRSKKSLDLLLDEKTSHDETKVALVSRDQYLAVVSHDLKNPLGNVSLGAELLRESLVEMKGDFSLPMKYLDIIDRNAASMDRMISDLLDVERIGNGKLSVYAQRGDINELFVECQSLFAPVLANRKFTMSINVNQLELCAMFDHDRIMQVMSNLIGNALKFASGGCCVSLHAQRKGDGVEISVSDDGPGIPADRMASIFDRFSQLESNDRRGLGLGLYISKWIVEAHQGQIWATSQPGLGSTFHFTLPLSPIGSCEA